jgi:hypothetical protein
MDLLITCIAIAGLLATTVFAGWKAGRPRRDSLRPQWISWPFVTVLSGALLVFAVIHLMNLFGIHTGQNMTSRYGG